MNRHDVGLIASSVLVFVVSMIVLPFSCALGCAAMMLGFIVFALTFDEKRLPFNPIPFLSWFGVRFTMTVSSLLVALYAMATGCG